MTISLSLTKLISHMECAYVTGKNVTYQCSIVVSSIATANIDFVLCKMIDNN